jgi:predicted TIM-barrel fold metal-dependent hydrolase
MSTSGSIDELLATIDVVDADTHIIEPYDLWTSRISVSKWGDKVPHVIWDEERQSEVWVSGETLLHYAASSGAAGYEKAPPDNPRRWSHMKPEVWRAEDRLRLMTDYGIHSAVLYPNVPGFGAGKFTNVAGQDNELGLELFRAYNDFLIDYCSTDTERFIPVMAIPFWDLDLSIREMERSMANGHRGIIFSQQPELYHCPMLGDRHWDRIWAAAEEMGLPVNFHVGSGTVDIQMLPPECGRHANYASVCASIFLTNSQAISTMIGSGVCHRFPDLNIVSVESGVSWLPFLLEGLDWMWKESAVTEEHPEYDLLPSEYFRRQIYGCFWFEYGGPLEAAIDYVGADRVLYETDFPHSTSMSPGPKSTALPAKEFIARNLGHLQESTLRKILHENAARLYKLT